MQKYKFKIMLLISILFIVLIIKLYMNYLFIIPIHTNSNKKFGIIDGTLCQSHNNVIKFSSFEQNIAPYKQHGDYILDFLHHVTPEVSFYYYDAELNGKISTDYIIAGLQWMVECKVDCVAISLSSKQYSEKLEHWILKHSNKIEIYASYNNSLNSFDYPAQYKKVVGVGTTDVINSKNTDILYRSYNLIILDTKIKQYSGNSYLTPYTMVKNSE